MEIIRNEQKATAWVNEYSDILYSYVVQRVKDTHLAKDLVQETFLAAWRNIDKYNGEASVKTWLFTILKNKIIDHYRKVSTRLTDELTESSNDETVFFNDSNHWNKNAFPKDWGAKSTSNVESKEFYSILNICKKKLKEIQAAVFSLKYMEDLSSEEICKELNITSSNYWVLIHRAKIQLRSCMESNWLSK